MSSSPATPTSPVPVPGPVPPARPAARAGAVSLARTASEEVGARIQFYLGAVNEEIIRGFSFAVMLFIQPAHDPVIKTVKSRMFPQTALCLISQASHNI